MTDPQPIPDTATPAIDADDDDDDDVADGADDLPDDVPNDKLPEPEVRAPSGNVADTDVDVPVEGEPLTDDQIGEIGESGESGESGA
jgi:hypothetical protein